MRKRAPFCYLRYCPFAVALRPVPRSVFRALRRPHRSKSRSSSCRLISASALRYFSPSPPRELVVAVEKISGFFHILRIKNNFID